MHWFLVSSGHVDPDSLVPAQPAYTAVQTDLSQESVKPKSTCLAPRASVIKEQGFSEAVAARGSSERINQISL